MIPAADLTWRELLSVIDPSSLGAASRVAGHARVWQAWNEIRARLLGYAVLELRGNRGVESADLEEVVDDLLLQLARPEFHARAMAVSGHAGFFRLILRRRFVDRYRRQARELELRHALVESEPTAFVMPDEPEIEHAGPRVRIRAQRLWELILALPPVYREVIQLRYGEDLSLDEVADRLGQTKNTVSVRLHRALKLLREMVDRSGLGPQP